MGEELLIEFQLWRREDGGVDLEGLHPVWGPLWVYDFIRPQLGAVTEEVGGFDLVRLRKRLEAANDSAQPPVEDQGVSADVRVAGAGVGDVAHQDAI